MLCPNCKCKDCEIWCFECGFCSDEECESGGLKECDHYAIKKSVDKSKEWELIR